MKFKRTIFYLVAIILVIIVAFYSRNAAAPMTEHAAETKGKIKVGIMAPISGDGAVSGEKFVQGAMLAAKEYANVELVIEDTQSQTTKAASIAQKLANIDNVDVVVGPYIPDEVIVAAPILEQGNIDAYAGALCVDKFVPLKNIYCGYPGAEAQLETLLPYLEHTPIAKLALVNTNDEFGLSSRDAIKAIAAKHNIEIVLDELVPFGQKDLRGQAAKVMAAKADGIFMASGDTAQAYTLMKLAEEQGFKGQKITFVDVDTKLIKQFPAAQNTLAPGIVPNAFDEKFISDFKAEYRAAPSDYLPGLIYDITRAAIKNTSEKKHIALELVAGQNQKTAIPGFSIKPDRTVSFDLELWMVRMDSFIPVKNKI